MYVSRPCAQRQAEYSHRPKYRRPDDSAASALAFPDLAQRGAGSSLSLTPLHPVSARSGPQPPPIPPAVGSRLSGVLEAGVGGGKHHGFGKMTRPMQSSLALECGKKNARSHTPLLAKTVAFTTQSQHGAVLPEQWPPAGFCRVSPCSRARRAQGRQPCPLGLHCRRSPGTSSSRQQPRLPPPPRPAEASSHTGSSAHAPGCPTEHQPGSWPALRHSRAAVR